MTEVAKSPADTFDAAIARFEASGFMLARLETLLLAQRDRRLERSALIVLGYLIEAINRETMTTYIGRDAIAAKMGCSAKTVSNHIWQLRALGYIASEQRVTPQANNRSLLHYTLTALSPEELERTIARALSSMRGERDSVVAFQAVPGRQGTDTPSVPGPQGTQFPAGKEQPDEFLAGKDASSRPAGCSNTSLTSAENLTPVDASLAARPARGTRLPDDWLLPKPWGEWTLENFEVSAANVRVEAQRFRDYWIAKAGKDATKRDWFATWRNWCGSDIRAWKPRKTVTTHAPDLVDHAPVAPKIRRY